MELLSQSKTPLTIKKVEFADGAFALFSSPPTPVTTVTPPTQVTQTTPGITMLEPTVAPPPPPKAPLPPPPPAPPSVLALQLNECPAQVGAALDAKMGENAKKALELTHQNTVFESKANPSPLYNGPLHSARKAMLARALTNFHRKHSQDKTVRTRDAGFIPDSVMPAVELGVLHTKPVPNAVLNQNGRIGLWLDPHQQLMNKAVPESTAKAIATATSGYQSDPGANILDLALRDAEIIDPVKN